MLRPKKYSCKEFDNKKKFLRLKNSPPPPHNFSNGPSLRGNHFQQTLIGEFSKLTQLLSTSFIAKNVNCRLS